MILRMTCIWAVIILFLHMSASLKAAEEKAVEEKEAIEIPLIDNPPILDGKLNDPVWENAVSFKNFISFKPDFGKPASEETIVYACSDQENFYFAARCFQKDISQIKGGITKRDNIFGDDWLAIGLDTFNDKQTAYGFIVNPFGIQGDGMLDVDGNLDGSQDMIWYTQAVLDDKGYSVEIKIPFKSIRFPIEKKVKMGLWIVRNIVRTSENICFPELSPDKGAVLSQMQPILVKDMTYQRVVELLPAFTHSRFRVHEEGQWAAEKRKTDYSLTAKVGITPSLVIDTTYNPDFSQVEADAGQVDINLRYSIYYQEKRPFFLEGMEAFQFAGNTEDAPLLAVVHTRTILDPLFGVKVTGKLGSKNSVAAIFALDEPLNSNDATSETGQSRASFGILRFRHAIANDSYLGGFYTGRDVSHGYNRVAGIDGRFRISENAAAEYHVLGSLTKNPGDMTNTPNTPGHALGLRYKYSSRTTVLDLGIQDVSRNFQIDTGFLTRQGVSRLGFFGSYSFYPKSTFFQRLEPFYWSYHLLDKESNLVETFNMFTFRIYMPRTSVFRLDLILANEVFAGKRFGTSGIGFQVLSQITERLYFHLFFRHNGSVFYEEINPFAGKSNRFSLTLEYQPTDKFNNLLDLTYTDFYRKLDSQKEYKYTIIRNRTTFQMNKYLFFRAIVEYNAYWKRLFLDALASFTYIPGTVVHVGYGSIQEKTCWNGEEYIPSDKFLEINRAFFFKVSYLWRF